MSEQVIIDREAPPWAQRLQTDLNAALVRLDRRLVTLTTSLANQTQWINSSSFDISTSTAQADFSVPEEATHVRVYGSWRPVTTDSYLAFIESPDGTTFRTAAVYAHTLSGSTAGVAFATAAYGTIAPIGLSCRNDMYGWFDLTINRGLPGTSWLRYQSISSGFNTSGTREGMASGICDPGVDTSGDRFFRLLASSGNIANLYARVTYQT